jgi:hypothetical protein
MIYHKDIMQSVKFGVLIATKYLRGFS